MDDDTTFWGVLACILALTALGMLHSKAIGMMADDAADLRTDVQFLMDHAQIRETEARP
jgi:hypothetical protein